MPLGLRGLKRELKTVAARRGRRQYSAQFRSEVVAAVSREKAAGSSLSSVAVALGLPLSTLSYWLRRREQKRLEGGVFRAVVIRDKASGGARSGRSSSPSQPRPTPTLVTAAGHRVEGLQLAELIEVLRRLG